MAKSSGRVQKCADFQDEMARKRERDSCHQRKWDTQVRYYKSFDKANNKFEEWTSPRYYESNNELVAKIKRDREKKDGLAKRREKLRRLLAEDEATHRIELTVAKARSAPAKTCKFQDIPTELLTDVNVGLKLAEDEKRRHRAEIGLYHQWRNNNPAIKEAERSKSSKDLKLSWLDQQIEKRMAKEREQEECRAQLKERDERIEREKRKEELVIEETKRKNRLLRDDVLKQMEELKLKQELGDDLKRQECEEHETRRKISELQDERKTEEARRRSEECALFNVKQHKLKLKRRARDVLENVQREVDLARQILQSEAVDAIRNDRKRREIRETLEQFLEFSSEQRQLEKRRQEYLDFIFDSEAKLMYEKQQHVWSREQEARKTLIDDVLDAVKSQIESNIERNKDRQKEVLLERERMLRDIENWDREMSEMKMWEEEKKREFKKEMDAQLKAKREGEKRLKALEKNAVDLELDGVKREEERLKKEIVKIQKTRAPVRYARKKVWY